MKQTILALAIIFFTIQQASAQQNLSLQQTLNGSAIFNGTEITISSTSAEEKIECYLYVRNNGEFAIDVTVKKFHLSILENTTNNMCWGDACLAPTAFESSPETILPGAITDTLFFTGHYLPNGNTGTTKVMYVFFDANNPIDSVGVIVNFMAGETGLADYILNKITFSDPYPNPARDVVQFDYSLPDEVDEARLTIFNLTGAKVAEELVYSRNGKMRIKTSDLHGGYYFYSLVIGVEAIIGGKVVVVR